MFSKLGKAYLSFSSSILIVNLSSAKLARKICVKLNCIESKNFF
jgi:hypothetical protein